jgi:Patatin phospholipase
MIESSSDIVKIIYVDRLDDGNTIFGKAFEFSNRTVNQLQESGYNDAQIALEIESQKYSVRFDKQ